jgi:predicted transcriptional regulator
MSPFYSGLVLIFTMDSHQHWIGVREKSRTLPIFDGINHDFLIELDDGKNYRKALYLMVKTMVFCRFSLKPIQ